MPKILKNDRPLDDYDFLTPLLQQAPAAWALIRANELRALQKVSFKNPALDVGCGDGLVAKVLLEARGGGYFDWGIDLSAKEIAKALASGAYKKCQVASVYRLPFKDSSFQTVFSNSVIEHIGDLPKALEEMSRVLKPGGQFIITVPSSYLGQYLIGTKLLKRLGLVFLADLYSGFFNKLFKHYNLYNHGHWEKLLLTHNLRLVDHYYYHTQAMIGAHEVLSYFALPAHLLKAIFGYWPVFPPFRKRLIVPWLKKLLIRFYRQDCDMNQGGSVLLVAKKGA